MLGREYRELGWGVKRRKGAMEERQNAQISREIRTGILLIPSIVGNANSQLSLPTEHVLGLKRQIIPILVPYD